MRIKPESGDGWGTAGVFVTAEAPLQPSLEPTCLPPRDRACNPEHKEEQRGFLQHSGATSHPHRVLCKTKLQEQKPSFCNNLTFIAFAGKKFYSSRKTVLPYTKPTTEFIQKPDAAINVKMKPSLNLRWRPQDYCLLFLSLCSSVTKSANTAALLLLAPPCRHTSLQNYQMIPDLQLLKLSGKIHRSQHKIYSPAITQRMIKPKRFHSCVRNKLLSLAKIGKQFIKLAATTMRAIKYSDLQQNNSLNAPSCWTRYWAVCNPVESKQSPNFLSCSQRASAARRLTALCFQQLSHSSGVPVLQSYLQCRDVPVHWCEIVLCSWHSSTPYAWGKKGFAIIYQPGSIHTAARWDATCSTADAEQSL